MGFGSVSQLCSNYQAILAGYAEHEGKVNNIVAHDENGHPASKTYYEHYPEVWR